MTRARDGLVLQGYFRTEQHRAPTATAATVQQRSNPPPPRPDLLPSAMRRGPAQAKPEPGLSDVWRLAPRPELLPGMGASRVGKLRVAQPRLDNVVSTMPVPPGRLRATGPGRSLATGVRQSMERFFAADFSSVRVHIGSEAPEMGALAFTLGEEIHFAPGLYNPTSREGNALLGHELTHVVQQREGRVVNPYGHGVAIVQDPALEAEADWMGQRVAEGMWMSACASPPMYRRALAHGAAAQMMEEGGASKKRTMKGDGNNNKKKTKNEEENKPHVEPKDKLTIEQVGFDEPEAEPAIRARKDSKPNDRTLRNNWAVAQGSYTNGDLTEVFCAASDPGASSLLHAERNVMRDLCAKVGAKFDQQNGEATARALIGKGITGIAKWYTELPPCPSCESWCRSFATAYPNGVTIGYCSSFFGYFNPGANKGHYFDGYLKDIGLKK